MSISEVPRMSISKDNLDEAELIEMYTRGLREGIAAAREQEHQDASIFEERIWSAIDVANDAISVIEIGARAWQEKGESTLAMEMETSAFRLRKRISDIVPMKD
jgi:hypothetical protein